MPSVNDRRPAFLHTIGARLTLWGTAVTLLVCFCLCAILYVSLGRSLRREVDGFLEGEVQELRSLVIEESGEGSPLAHVETEIRKEMGSRIRSDLIFRILDDKGKMLITSETHAQLPDPWILPPVNEPNDSGMRLDTVDPREGHTSVRVCSRWHTLENGRAYILQAAYTLNGVNRSLGQFGRICMAALAVASILALAGGYWLARRSLRPVDTMTRAARRIGMNRLSQRLSRTGNDDELDRLAATLNDMLDRIERQVRQVQQFSADAAHELRTPLTALRGAAEVALSQSRSVEQLRHTLEESIEHYDRLSRVAESLLFLARMDSGESILVKQRMKLNDVLADVADLYAPLASERGLTLSHDPSPDIWINGDPGRLHQLVGNLVDNAVKYTPAGGRIEIRATQNNGDAVIEVRDTGIGIAEQDAAHVFDRFYRADRSRSVQNAMGAGLGLSICQGIAKAHAGDIRITSQKDAGAVVTVKLPCGQ